MRRKQRIGSLIVILGLLFAQLMAAVHACPVMGSPAPTPYASRAVQDSAMPADCPTVVDQHPVLDQHRDDGDDGCVSHCVTDQQVDAQSVLATPARAPAMPLVVGVASPDLRVEVTLYSQFASSRAPPRLALFSRLRV